jgi:hypothetical protein
MPAGTRETWAKLLPIIEAFVKIEPIQKKNYKGNWVDVDLLYGLLDGTEFRLKPEEIVKGVWKRSFIGNFPDNSVTPIITTDLSVMYIGGASDESPVWPSLDHFEYVSEPRFEPDV